MIESPQHRRRRDKALDWLADALDVDRVQLALLLTDVDSHYRPYDKITAGKKPRRIDNPADLPKSVQRRMLFRFLKHRAYDEILHGSVPGRSPLTNAGQHLGQACLVRLDIAAFFPHVTVERVYDVWTRQLGLPPERARLLTRLSTFQGHLPQGAPTSSYLANLALAGVDERVKAEAAKDLAVFFDDVFRKHARFCLILISRQYLERPWTDHERRSALARMVNERGGEYVLPGQIDPVELPGLAPTIGYLSAERYSTDQIADLLIEKLKKS